MWDEDQLAEIAVLTDELQARGDPLGEWFALRQRLESEQLVPHAERESLRRRTRSLRQALGPRLVLADNPRLGQPHVMRERGLISDVIFASASPGSLAELLARPDAGFVTRLRLRADVASVLACVELLLDGAVQHSLRELSLEVVDGAGESDESGAARLRLELEHGAVELGQSLARMYWLELEDAPIELPWVDIEEQGSAIARAWSPWLRTQLGRALASPHAQQRKRALEQLRAHAEHSAQLRRPLLQITQMDGEAGVRAAALAVIAQIGGATASAMFAILSDSARRRDDEQLRRWLELLGRAPRA